MVQPKYNPEEALRLIKLRMGYDSSKTLNENISVLKEQDTAADVATIKGEFNAMNTDEQRIVNILKKYDTQAKFETMLMKYKEVNKKELGLDLRAAFSLPDDKTEIDDLKNFLYGIGYAVEEEGSRIKNFLKVDQQNVAGGFQNLKRVKEIKKIVCSANKNATGFNITIAPAKGQDLMKWADRNGVTKEEIETARKSCSVKDTNSGGGSKKSSYTACSGEYKRGCKSDVIRQVQVCLGMAKKYQTGNFGPITQGELAKVGKSFAMGFKDADIKTICNQTPATPTQVLTPGETSVEDNINA